MSIGSSQGVYYQDEGALLLDQSKEAIRIRPVEGQPDGVINPDQPNRMNVLPGRSEIPQEHRLDGLQTLPTMPLGGSPEPAGALELPGGSNTPAKVPTQESHSIIDKLLGTGGAERYQTLPERAIRDLISAVKAPGEAVQGNLPSWATDEKGEFHTSPQMIEKASDLAELAVFGPSPWASKLADGTLGSFAGVKSKKVDLQALGHAQVLEANGAHPDVVLKQTGFARGADNKWRYEIDDSKASFDRKWAENYPTDPRGLAEKLKMGKTTNTLPNILDHPELYKAYPHLRDVRVTFDPKYTPKGAEWSGGMEQRITLGPGAHTNQGTLMHEVQHAIQDHEGFAKGGSPGEVGKDFELKYTKAVNDLIPESQTLVNKSKSGERFTSEEKARANYITQVFQKYQDYKAAGQKEAYKNYLRLAGEAEARNTDTRLLLTAQERKTMPPAWTEDVARRNQISVDRPATTSAYGVMDPETGLTIKSKSEPTTFRRGANDNLPEGHPDRPYNVREPEMLGSKAMDDAIDRSWNNMGAKFARGNKILDEMARLRNNHDLTKDQVAFAKYKKLSEEHQKLFPPSK